MATIYSTPDDEITKPQHDFVTSTIKSREEGDKAYIDKVKAYAKEYSEDNCVECGEIIRFPIADGCAEYMIMSLKPKVELIDLAMGDAYQFGYVELLTLKEVKEKVSNQKAIGELFS